MRTHGLKCWPSSFEAILDGRKRFDLRRDDRQFEVGDSLRFLEWNPDREEYTSRTYWVTITYILKSGSFPGLETGYVILGIAPLG